MPAFCQHDANWSDTDTYGLKTPHHNVAHCAVTVTIEKRGTEKTIKLFAKKDQEMDLWESSFESLSMWY